MHPTPATSPSATGRSSTPRADGAAARADPGFGALAAGAARSALRPTPDVEHRPLPALTCSPSATASRGTTPRHGWPRVRPSCTRSSTPGRATVAGPDGALYASDFFEAHSGEVTAFVPVLGAPVGERRRARAPGRRLAVTRAPRARSTSSIRRTPRSGRSSRAGPIGGTGRSASTTSTRREPTRGAPHRGGVAGVRSLRLSGGDRRPVCSTKGTLTRVRAPLIGGRPCRRLSLHRRWCSAHPRILSARSHGPAGRRVPRRGERHRRSNATPPRTRSATLTPTSSSSAPASATAPP